MLEQTKSAYQSPSRCWIIGEESIPTLQTLVKSFRHAAISQVSKLGFSAWNYLPWMDAFPDHQDEKLLASHKISNHLLVDEGILSQIEIAFIRNENPLGFFLREEKSFRVLREIAHNPAALERYKKAFDLFFSQGTYWQKLFKALCNFVVPIYSTRESVRSGGVGFSTLRARGAIFLSLPKDLEHSHLELSINLAHELGHQALMIYQGADRILKGELDAPVYSVVRNTMRPAIWSFHAVVAVAFMLMMVSDLISGNSISEQERLYLLDRHTDLKRDLIKGIQTCESLDFTAMGLKLFQEFKDLAEIFAETQCETA